MSASKDKGTRFETAFVRHEREALGDTEGTIRRTALRGADEGDVYGLTAHGRRIAIQCKDHRRYELPAWLDAVEVQRGNADALAGVVVFHLNGRGLARMGEQAVLMTVDDFNAILTGERVSDGD